MKYEETAEKLAEYRSEIADIREKMRSAQASTEPEEVQDYEFATPQGKARLSALFGDKDTLFVIHNMGTTCAHCTMWADGFNGVFEHLRDRAAFVVGWRRRTRPSDSRVSPPVAAGSFPWSRTKARRLRRIWAIARMAALCRAFRSSSARATRSCGWRIRPSALVTISAVSGTSLISFRKAPPVGDRNLATQAE
jgi:Bacterial protein of unknown function (DUF899)